jgi:hypothetical protein
MSNDGVHDPIVVEADEDEPPFALVGDWVTLAPISDRAVRIYCLLRAHVNHKRNDDEVWPTQITLAAVLGLSKADEVGKAIKELEKIGAVRKTMRSGRKGKYTVYVVRLHPPAGYVGLRNVAVDLYRRGAVDQLVTERVKRLPHRIGKTKKARSEDVTPDQGCSPKGVTPDLGLTPDQAPECTPDLGYEPYKEEPDEPKDTQPARERAAAPPPCVDLGPVDELDPDEIEVPLSELSRPRAAAKVAARWNRTAHSPESAELVARYCAESPLPADTQGRLRPVVSKLLREGFADEVILRAISECFAEGCGPTLLPDFVAKVQHRGRKQATSTTRFENQVQQHREMFNPDGSWKVQGQVVQGEVVDVQQMQLGG